MTRWAILMTIYLTPGVGMVAIGVLDIAAGFSPWLAARVGHGPLWVSLVLILFGGFNLWLPIYAHWYLRRRAMRLIASKVDRDG